MSPSRAACRELADRLSVEYCGAVPPGQVLAIVFRTAHRLAAVSALSPETRLEECEAAARRALTERICGPAGGLRPAVRVG
jgi:hypothetical protein